MTKILIFLILTMSFYLANKHLAGTGLWFALLAIFLWTWSLAGYLYRKGHPVYSNSRTGTRKKPSGVIGPVLNWITQPVVQSTLTSSMAPTHSLQPSLVSEAATSNPQTRILKPDEIAKSLEAKIFGQKPVCKEVAAGLGVGMAQEKRKKPLGTFLFAGPPGTGKTYMAKLLAKILNRNLLHLDMSQFSDPIAATSLFGASKGFMGSDSYGTLTGALKANPETLVLLDDFEKASPTVHKKFLTAFSEGFITEGANTETISTVQAIFVLTTNAGYERLTELIRDSRANPSTLTKPIRNVLREHQFAPELLDRFDQILVFAPLEWHDLARVACLELNEYVHSFDMRLGPRGIEPELLFHLIVRQREEGAVGVRDMIRFIHKSCGPTLAEFKGKNIYQVKLYLGKNNNVEVRRA